jgi:hypothetical protein
MSNKSAVAPAAAVPHHSGIAKRLQRALDSAVKYGLVANSIKSKLILEPESQIVPKAAGTKGPE